MALIYLTQGKTTVVDDAQAIALQGQKCHAVRIGKLWYAKIRQEYLHRLILMPPSGMQVDHINGDSLDNRRDNLRLCTPQQQSFNTAQKRQYRRFKGVRSGKRENFYAFICANRKFIHLGAFDTEVEAAKAYDAAATAMHGEFAHLNFP